MTHLARRFAFPALLAFTITSLLAVSSLADTGTDEQREQKTFALRSGGTLVLKHERGRVSVQGWDKDQVVVDVVKRYEGGSTAERDEWLRDTKVNFTSESGRLEIEVERANRFCIGICYSGRGTVDLTIHAPRKVQLDIHESRADLQVTDIEGDLRLRNERSSVQVERLTGGVRIESERGPVRLRDVNVRGDFDVSVERAEFEFQGSGLPRGGRVQSERGDVVLRLPENVALNVEVNTDRRSSFRSDFPIATTTSYNSEKLRGTVNGGGPLLRLESTRGPVRLLRYVSPGRM
ncbi:MAG TPA: hypothetical protein VFA60_10605 [Terriglobales bacterium]|nr:hypothetical protein [Terriglobales bacterium]